MSTATNESELRLHLEFISNRMDALGKMTYEIIQSLKGERDDAQRQARAFCKALNESTPHEVNIIWSKEEPCIVAEVTCAGCGVTYRETWDYARQAIFQGWQFECLVCDADSDISCFEAL